MRKAVSAGVIIYRLTKEGPKFLLLYHDKSYWNFPKGTLEKGEGSFKAALREIREETGLTPRDLKFRNNFRAYNRYVFMGENQKIFKTVIFYLAETHQAEIKVSDEHEGYGWFSYRDGVKIIKHKTLKPILKKAYDVIIHRKSLAGGQKNPPRPSLHLPGHRQSHRPA